MYAGIVLNSTSTINYYYLSAPYSINPATLGTVNDMTVFDLNVVFPESPHATTDAMAGGATMAGRFGTSFRG